MTVRAQIMEMLDLIPDIELNTVLEVVRHFVPVEQDDIASAGDLKAHEEAMIEYAEGNTVKHEDIDWS